MELLMLCHFFLRGARARKKIFKLRILESLQSSLTNASVSGISSTSSSPLCTKFLSTERTSSLRYFSSGDTLRKKTSKPRNQGGDA